MGTLFITDILVWSLSFSRFISKTAINIISSGFFWSTGAVYSLGIF